MRTEEQVFNDFKELGYSLKQNQDNNRYVLSNEDEFFIIIGRKRQWYCKKDEHTSYLPISVREHKLLHELFEIWEWF
jgi:hypothetical protein